MTYVEQAIKKAIEGGFDVKRSLCIPEDAEANYPMTQVGAHMWQEICSNPLFWQSIGQAMGWGSFYDDEGMIRVGFDTQGWRPNTHGYRSGTDSMEWQAHWHRFIDYLAEGRDAESFFKSLLDK